MRVPNLRKGLAQHSHVLRRNAPILSLPVLYVLLHVALQVGSAVLAVRKEGLQPCNEGGYGVFGAPIGSGLGLRGFAAGFLGTAVLGGLGHALPARALAGVGLPALAALLYRYGAIWLGSALCTKMVNGASGSMFR